MTTVSSGQEAVSGPFKGFGVDGAAWHNMLLRNGVERTNFKGLYFIACKLGLALPFVEEPRSTIHPDHCKKGGDLFESMRRAGILPRAVESFRERDDQLVMKWISRWVARKDVSNIVFATCDGAIIDFALDAVSTQRWSKGDAVRVDVIGTLTPDEDGCCPVCRDVLRDICRLPNANFHDVRNYRTLVMQSRLRH